MSEIAVVVLAHEDPVHVNRLVSALEDVPVFLHCDVRTPRVVSDQMLQGLPDRVTVSRRFATARASWPLVEAEMAALRAVVKVSAARHVAVLSGSDYPLVSMQELADQLRDWDGMSYWRNVPLPFSEWKSPVHRDGGFWRLRYRFVTRRGHAVFVRGFPLHWPRKRQIPPDLEPRAASQWKIYSRHHVEMLLHAADTRPDLMRFWRSTHVPDESFAASMLGSRAIFGSHAMPPCLAQPWFLIWPEVGSHPQWLRAADFVGLSEARWAPPISPETAVGAPGTRKLWHRKFFARKFSTFVDTDVLDRIDDELRR